MVCSAEGSPLYRDNMSRQSVPSRVFEKHESFVFSRPPGVVADSAPNPKTPCPSIRDAQSRYDDLRTSNATYQLNILGPTQTIHGDPTLSNCQTSPDLLRAKDLGTTNSK